MNGIFNYINAFLKHKSRGVAYLALFVLVLLSTSACTDSLSIDPSNSAEENISKVVFEKEKKQKLVEVNQSQLKVHYINVGQGDSTFVELPNGENVLIDGGTRSNGQTVSDYLNDLQVERIDYLIATHPHEDHIGGLVNVVKEFDIGKIYMPDKAHTTIVFEDLLLAIQEQGYSITKAEAGDIIFEEEGLSMNILAPSEISGSNLNNYSIANRLVFGNTAFVFTGDAEQKSEKNMVESGYELAANVLKVGHHGGDTSSISSFLSAVNPDYGVISTGENNQYGHPHMNVMNRLADYGIKTFRTDKDGTIIAISDGETIEFNQKSTEIVKSPAAVGEQVDVYRTDTGLKYHRVDCHTLKHSKVAIPLNEAKGEGLEACGICKPEEQTGGIINGSDS